MNLTGTSIGLDAAQRHGVERFVFASSSRVYGERPRGPFVEDLQADRPLSPDGATKRGGELLCHAAHHTSGMPVTCLRFFTAHGPRQRPDLAIHKWSRLVLEGKPVTLNETIAALAGALGREIELEQGLREFVQSLRDSGECASW